MTSSSGLMTGIAVDQLDHGHDRSLWADQGRARPGPVLPPVRRGTDGGVLPETRPPDDAPRTRSAPPGIGELPSGRRRRRRARGAPDDDTLAPLYRWPDRRAQLARSSGRTWSRRWTAATTVHGRSGGLGNAADEHLFALLRDLADVILVGAGTVRAEHYGGIRLTAERAARRLRWGLTAEPPPIAVVTARGLDPTVCRCSPTRDAADRDHHPEGAETVPAPASR